MIASGGHAHTHAMSLAMSLAMTTQEHHSSVSGLDAVSFRGRTMELICCATPG